MVKQGTVLGPICCGSSIAEYGEENGEGGISIGSTSIASLAHVDGIVNVNSKIGDVISSHEAIKWFSKKKRLELRVKKCNVLQINTKPSNPVPLLEINGEEMKVKEKVIYLGDVLNTRGNNNDLIEDKAKKGKEVIKR